MNVSRIEIHGKRGVSIRYLEERNTVIFTALEAKVTGVVTNVWFDDFHLDVERARGLSGAAREGKIVQYNRLKYPIKLGFYGMRPRC